MFSRDKFKRFNYLLQHSKDIIVLTGAGVSAESGIPVFRGSQGIWRKYRSQDVATPAAFESKPGLVWEFYHYRREMAFNAQPNRAHIALAKYENICKNEGRNFNIITQNVDGLHIKAGSENVTELHGSLRKVICTKCKNIEENTTVPICEALAGTGDPDLKEDPEIPLDLLPKCSKCQGLLRPYIVWFGENLEPKVLSKARDLVENCDLCVIVGTSSSVYPAAMFAPMVSEQGKPVVEFNIGEQTEKDNFAYYFDGPCGLTLPVAFGVADQC